jgi:hypothetical protein
MVQSLLQFPPTVPSFDVLPPLATVDDLQCSSVSGELVQLLQSVRLDSWEVMADLPCKTEHRHVYQRDTSAWCSQETSLAALQPVGTQHV